MTILGERKTHSGSSIHNSGGSSKWERSGYIASVYYGGQRTIALVQREHITEIMFLNITKVSNKRDCLFYWSGFCFLCHI